MIQAGLQAEKDETKKFSSSWWWLDHHHLFMVGITTAVAGPHGDHTPIHGPYIQAKEVEEGRHELKLKGPPSPTRAGWDHDVTGDRAAPQGGATIAVPQDLLRAPRDSLLKEGS